MATATGTVTLRATFANDDEALFPNEFVNVRLGVDTLHGAVLVPTAAVQNGAPGDYVYLVNANRTVSVHKVTLGPSDGRTTAIVAGLAAGQQVVTDGVDRLSDGAAIRIAPTRAAGAQPASGASGVSTPGASHHAGHRAAASGASGAA
jgi:membrane fusion protein, multidrug efflux system